MEKSNFSSSNIHGNKGNIPSGRYDRAFSPISRNIDFYDVHNRYICGTIHSIITKFEKMAQMKSLWMFINAFGGSIYFIAIATNWDTIKAIVLLVLGVIAAVIKIGEYAVQLAKRWIEYKQYRKDVEKEIKRTNHDNKTTT